MTLHKGEEVYRIWVDESIFMEENKPQLFFIFWLYAFFHHVYAGHDSKEEYYIL